VLLVVPDLATAERRRDLLEPLWRAGGHRMPLSWWKAVGPALTAASPFDDAFARIVANCMREIIPETVLSRWASEIR